MKIRYEKKHIFKERLKWREEERERERERERWERRPQTPVSVWVYISDELLA